MKRLIWRSATFVLHCGNHEPWTWYRRFTRLKKMKSGLAYATKTLQFLPITQSFGKAKQNMLIAFSISRQRLTNGRKKNFAGGKAKVIADINYSMLMNGCYTCGSPCGHLSTNMPAWTAWTMLRKRGFSSLRRSIRPIWRVKVEASQSRTSEGTDSDWMSLSSSSVSTRRLEGRENGKRSEAKYSK